MRWALTEVDNTPTYLGKWGHRMLAWVTDNAQGEEEPALYLIAGDAVEGGSFVSDVFVSTETREKHAFFCVVCVVVQAFLFSLIKSERIIPDPKKTRTDKSRWKPPRSPVFLSSRLLYMSA